MCGIVGYVGPREATPLLVAGLRKLEYRGYDSAGLAVTDSGQMQVVRCRGKLAGLETMVAKEPPQGRVEVVELADGARDLDGATRVNGEAGRVVPAIFELAQPVEQQGRTLLVTHVRNDSAHSRSRSST